MSTEIKADYIEQDQFEQLLNNEELVVVDYTATWCGPCRLISPFIDRLASEYQGRAVVVKVDLDRNKDNAKQYQIRSIPTVLFFKKGEVVERLVGKAPYETYSNTLEKYLRID